MHGQDVPRGAHCAASVTADIVQLLMAAANSRSSSGILQTKWFKKKLLQFT
jgi:hypothetical protein